jgi:hypothetical protein
VFSFNPHAVPSVRINGKREPICRECIDTANVGRAMRGEAKIEVAPNAYESIDEEEL